jgi:hypothetical protein
MKGVRESVLVVELIHVVGEHQLFGVVHAQDALGLALRLRQSGQEQPGQNGDDRDHH